MYLLKIRGTKSMPDFVQLRDENMTLLAYFTPSNAEKTLHEFGLKRSSRKKVVKLLDTLDYGYLTAVALKM